MTTAPAPPAGRTSHRVPAAVKGLSAVSLLNDFASEMVYPLLPALVTGPLGAGALALGALDGAAELASSGLKWVSGRLADRPGWRNPLVLVGYTLAVAVRPLIALAGAAWQVVGLRVVDRVGKGLRTSPRDALIAAVTPPAIRGRAFGLHRGADHFGAVVGALAAWALLEGGAGVREVIGWSAVPGVVALVVLGAVLRRVGRSEREADAPAGPVRPPILPADPPAPAPAPGPLGPAVVVLAALALARLPEALLLLRLQEVGVSVTMIPLVWAGLHVVRSASSYPGGRLADRLGPRLAVAAGGVLFAALAALLGGGIGPWAAVGAFQVLGLVAGLTEPAERVLVARLAAARLGRGFGAYHALTGAAALPAGIVFGALYQELGAATAFGASAAGVLVAVGVWLMLRLPL